jgi:enoyl-CoA hydratase
MSDGFSIVERGTVRVVTFERPEVMNAWDRPMRRALTAAIKGAADAPEVRALVFTGEGPRAFGAGQDLREPAPGLDEIDAWVDEWEDLFGALRACAKPTVIALNGVAAGSHFQFALLADARIAHPGARMGQPEIRSGVASSMGPWIVHAVLGAAAASDLVLSGRLMSAQECDRRGLLSKIVESEDVVPAAVTLAEEMGGRSPLAFRLTKERIRSFTEASFRETFLVWKRFLRETRLAERAG